MTLDLQFKIKNNPNYQKYLREEVKTTYKLRMSDRLEKIMNTMDMITSIVSSLK